MHVRALHTGIFIKTNCSYHLLGIDHVLGVKLSVLWHCSFYHYSNYEELNYYSTDEKLRHRVVKNLGWGHLECGKAKT